MTYGTNASKVNKPKIDKVAGIDCRVWVPLSPLPTLDLLSGNR